MRNNKENKNKITFIFQQILCLHNNAEKTKTKQLFLTCKVFFPELFGGWRRLTGQTCLQATTGC